MDTFVDRDTDITALQERYANDFAGVVVQGRDSPPNWDLVAVDGNQFLHLFDVLFGFSHLLNEVTEPGIRGKQLSRLTLRTPRTS